MSPLFIPLYSKILIPLTYTNNKYVNIGDIRVISSQPLRDEKEIIDIPNHKVISPK
jgi:hypothetical protein